MKGSRSPVRAALRCLAVVSAGALLAGYVYIAQSRAWKSPIHGTKSTQVLDDLRIPEAGGDAKVREEKIPPIMLSGSKSGILTTTIEAGALPLLTTPTPADFPPQRPPTVMPGSKTFVLSESLPPGWIQFGSVQLQMTPPPNPPKDKLQEILNTPRPAVMMLSSKSGSVVLPETWLPKFFSPPSSNAQPQIVIDRSKSGAIELRSVPQASDSPKQAAPFTDITLLPAPGALPLSGTPFPLMNGTSTSIPSGILPQPIVPPQPPIPVPPGQK